VSGRTTQGPALARQPLPNPLTSNSPICVTRSWRTLTLKTTTTTMKTLRLQTMHETATTPRMFRHGPAHPEATLVVRWMRCHPRDSPWASPLSHRSPCAPSSCRAPPISSRTFRRLRRRQCQPIPTLAQAQRLQAHSLSPARRRPMGTHTRKTIDTQLLSPRAATCRVTLRLVITHHARKGLRCQPMPVCHRKPKAD
jgi:hypothetical protein